MVETWHDSTPLLRSHIQTGNRKAFDKDLAKAIGQPHVIRDDDWLVQGNDNDDAYSAMNQANLGLTLARAYRKWNVKRYANLAVASLEPLLTPRNKKRRGLRWQTSDDTCWFHSVTDRDRDGFGGTLNQHLFAVLALLDAVPLLNRSEYRFAALAGTRQLWEDNAGPRLHDFIPRKHGDAIIPSWIYYAVTIPDKSGYFLRTDGKNATYQQLVMEQIRRIEARVPGFINYLALRPFFSYTLTNMEKKLLTGPLKDEKAPSGGDYDGFPDGHELITPTILNWYRSKIT